MIDKGRNSTCGGGVPLGIWVISTSNGQTYASVFSVLAKLQSYILLSSSDDNILYDSYLQHLYIKLIT